MDVTSYVILYFVLLAILGVIILYQNKKIQKMNSIMPLTLGSLKTAVITVDIRSQIEYVNKAALDLFKYNEQDLIGKNVNLYLEQSAGQYEKNVSQRTYESHCIDSGIKKIPVLITVRKVEDRHGKMEGNIYILKDITGKITKSSQEKNNDPKQEEKIITDLRSEIEQKKQTLAEKMNQRTRDFEEEHARLLASINNLKLGFILTDKDSNIILHNKSAELIVPALSIGSKSICRLKQINEKLYNLVEISIKDKTSEKVNDFELNSGFYNIFTAPILMEDTGQTCLGAVIVMENMSEQHSLEQSKEDLFSIASHELRTPLTAIYGYVSLIKQLYFSDLQNADLKDIINNIGILSKKLSLSINTFLDSSKLEQGKIEVKKDPCELYSIINEAVKETERMAIEKNLYVKLDLPPIPIMVTGDQLRLIQVMTILISNAVKFTTNGGVFISVNSEDNFAKISVRDTGAGIQEENKMLLFSKFQQTEQDLLTRQEGTGLGLHMAKLLIEKMGGSIRLEQTEINKGSTFSFTIPVYAE